MNDDAVMKIDDVIKLLQEIRAEEGNLGVHVGVVPDSYQVGCGFKMLFPLLYKHQVILGHTKEAGVPADPDTDKKICMILGKRPPPKKKKI